MIQRKQTLFLALAVIAYIFCLFLPIAYVEPVGMGTDSLIYNLGVVTGDGGLNFSDLEICLPLFLLVSLPAVISLATIFLYKNRKMQINLCSIASLFTVLWCIDFALVDLEVIQLTSVRGDVTFKFAACLPVVALILLLMARKGVSDDEKLVRAADRIR